MKSGASALAAVLAALVAMAPDNAAAPSRTDAMPAGRCVNMGNHLEPPQERAWGRAIADDDFRIIARAGFATVRLPVRRYRSMCRARAHISTMWARTRR